MLELIELRAVLVILWRQGFKRKIRFQFWRQLLSIIRHNPGVLETYLSSCALLEHFIEYRQTVRDEIEAQLVELSVGTNVKTQALTGIGR
jgi:hypothetical protein